MTLVTVAQLKRICKGKTTKSQDSNMKSFVDAVNTYGTYFGMDHKVNLSSLIGQVMVESGEFKYDREIWGPTAQQKKYEPGTDLAKKLGNTQKGDGSKFRGYGPIQLTGRGNVTRFYKWALANYSALGASAPPDFTKDPAKITTDPWEGLSALWYWGYGNPEGVSLNKYAADNNQLMVTKRVNGGTTHYAERLEYQARAALVLLGYGVSRDEIKRFQSVHQPIAGSVDGLIGDKTRAALHLAMKGKLPVTSVEKEVIREEVSVPVTVDDLEKPWYKDVEGIAQVGGGTLMTTVVSFITDADVQKILVVAGIAAAAFGVWYLIRRSKAKAQAARVKQINWSPARIKSVHTEVVEG